MHSGHLLAASCAKGEVVRKTQREQQALPAWQWTQCAKRDGDVLMRTALACEEECCGGGDGVCGLVDWRRGSQQKRRGEQKSRGQSQQEGAATKVTCGMIGA